MIPDAPCPECGDEFCEGCDDERGPYCGACGEFGGCSCPDPIDFDDDSDDLTDKEDQDV